jgi:hypothetical protein
MNHVSEISDDSMETVIWFGVSVVAKPSQPVEFERSDGFYCSALGTGCGGTKLWTAWAGTTGGSRATDE